MKRNSMRQRFTRDSQGSIVIIAGMAFPLLVGAFLVLRSRIRIALEEDRRREQFEQLV